jgi:cation diffusion facilitator family transporter
VHPQRRTALLSVVAAATLVVLKLVTGVASGSLGLLSEALHSGTDLVAALLTYFAIGVAVRPADPGHQYGHGKAEHLAALGEASILVVASLAIAAAAIARLAGVLEPEVDAAWWAFAVLGVVIAIDASRTTISLRTARRFGSAALQANALHFGGDLLGSSAVILGLAGAAAGYPNADSIAALFVACLVLAAAVRLMRRNVDVLMDQAPVGAHEAAMGAIEGIDPPVHVRRMRLRQAAGRHFADVVVGVPPGAAVGQGHAVADSVEEAVRRVLPGSDVVVHVEPFEDEAEIRDRAHAAALSVRRVREVHNVSVLHVGDRTTVSLHLKLPGELPLDEAHRVAEEVERAIAVAVPEVESVQTHIEPLAEPGAGRPAAADEPEREDVERIVRELTGRRPRSLRFLHTDEGLVAHLTLAVEPSATLADAHARASEVENEIRTTCGRIAEVIVHTEP